MNQEPRRRSMLTRVLVAIIYIVALLFVTRFLWNNALVKYTTVAKPVNTLFQMFLVLLAIAILRS
jgi:putative effector of murein hydrolase